MLPLMALVFALASCSESSDGVEEYPDWQHTNDTYFEKLYTATKAKIDQGDTSWKIIRSWSLESEAATKPYHYIIAHVESEGDGSIRPFYNDSVRVHYRGHLIPSTSYKSGYVFDQSYQGTFNSATAVPAKFQVSGVVNGFATALLNMHLGDRWEVYIPYYLGYGTDASQTIPGGSTLIFNIDLVGIYRAGTQVPDWKAAPNGDGWMTWE